MPGGQPKNPSKFTLNYDQIEARESDALSQECRGLVLQRVQGNCSSSEIVGETEILAFPFRRFFNYGQGAAAEVNFDDNNIKFFEKLDGTCCIVYFDSVLNEWCVATRSVPDADLPIDGFENTSFSSLFKKAFKQTSGLDFDTSFRGDKTYTYVFELCTPENQVVVYYPNYEVYLLGVRNKETHKELSSENYCSYLGVPCAPFYQIKTIAEMINFVSEVDPSKHEGLVVCDSGFNRVKVKSPGYLALNKLKDSIMKSPRAIIEVVLLEKEDDIMPMVAPHIQTSILEYKEKIRTYMKKLDEEFLSMYNEDRKTFALSVQALDSNMAYHMIRWTGKAKNAHDWIRQQKQKDGSYSNSFLDNIMYWIKKETK
jgi:hypothetical protein